MLRRRGLATQPQFGQLVDWSNPITRALQFATCGPTFFDAVTGKLMTVNTGTRDIGRLGFALNGNNFGQAQWSSARLSASLSGGTQASAFAYADATAANWNGNNTMDVIRCDGIFTPFQFVVPAGIPVLRCGVWQPGLNVSIYNGTSPLGFTDGLHSLGMTVDLGSGVVQFSLDGTVFLPSTIPTGPFSPSSSTDIAVGGTEAGNEKFRGRIYVAAVWNRILSQAEVTSLNESPYQLFQPVRQKLFFPPPSKPPLVFPDAYVDESNVGLLSGNFGTSYSFSTTVGANDNLLVVVAIVWNSNLASYAATYNGLPLTNLAGPGGMPNGNGDYNYVVSYLKSPPVGTATLAGSWSNNTSGGCIVAAFPITNANLPNPFGTVVAHGNVANLTFSAQGSGLGANDCYVGVGAAACSFLSETNPQMRPAGAQTHVFGNCFLADWMNGSNSGLFSYLASGSISDTGAVVVPIFGQVVPPLMPQCQY